MSYFSSKEQASFIFMAAVTICSDFGAQVNKVCHCFHCFPIYLPWSDGTRCHDLSLLNVVFKPAFSLSSFTFIKRLFNPSSLLSYGGGGCHLNSWGYWCFSRQSWFPACASSSPAFCMMYSAQKSISRETVHSLDTLPSQIWTSWEGDRQEGRGCPNGGNRLQVSFKILCCHNDSWFHQNLIFLKPWANHVFFLSKLFS